MKVIMTSLRAGKLLGVVLFCIMIWSCGSETTNQESTENQALANKLQDSSQFKVEAQNMIKQFPTPFEVTDLINKAGASYIFDLSNSIDNAEKYISVKSRALNLGIYGADLCYAITYNKKQETMNFLKANRELLSKLEIKANYDENFKKKIEANMNQKDTLQNMFTRQFNTTYDELNTADRTNVSAMIIAGGTVEGLYLVCQLTGMATNKTSELKKTIASQKETINKLIALLNLYKDDADIKGITPQIQEIKTILDGVSETISDDQLKTLSGKVEAIRNDWVK